MKIVFVRHVLPVVSAVVWLIHLHPAEAASARAQGFVSGPVCCADDDEYGSTDLAVGGTVIGDQQSAGYDASASLSSGVIRSKSFVFNYGDPATFANAQSEFYDKFRLVGDYGGDGAVPVKVSTRISGTMRARARSGSDLNSAGAHAAVSFGSGYLQGYSNWRSVSYDAEAAAGETRNRTVGETLTLSFAVPASDPAFWISLWLQTQAAAAYNADAAVDFGQSAYLSIALPPGMSYQSSGLTPPITAVPLPAALPAFMLSLGGLAALACRRGVAAPSGENAEPS